MVEQFAKIRGGSEDHGPVV
jgi:hypothetical protein